MQTRTFRRQRRRRSNKEEAHEAARRDTEIAKEHVKKLESEGFKKMKTSEVAQVTMSSPRERGTEDDDSRKVAAKRLTLGIGTFQNHETGEVKEVSDFPREFK